MTVIFVLNSLVARQVTLIGCTIEKCKLALLAESEAAIMLSRSEFVTNKTVTARFWP